MSDSMDPEVPDELREPHHALEPDKPGEHREGANGDEAPPVAISEASERDAALAAVLREQTEKDEFEEVERAVRVRRQGFGPRHLGLAFAGVLSMWIWMWPPAIVRIPDPAPLPLEEEEATLRLVMYFQAQRIEQYFRETGGVPLSLDDAGPVFQGMEYIRLTDRDYRILGRTGRVTLSYSSVEPLTLFVGKGASVLDVMTFH
jgi:hypothetical protein